MFPTIQDAHRAIPPRVRPGDEAPDYAAELIARLESETQAEVRFDAGSRALYASDGSNYRQTPIGVVVPRTTQDVITTVALCREFGAPILARGAGTSLAGQCCNIAVVLDFSKYLNRILELDPERKRARVQPGLVLDVLRHAAERHELTFGPDPATHTHCTIGGMIGNNSCGVHALLAGKTGDNIDEMEVLTYDGLRLRVGPTTDRELDAIIGAGGRRGEIYSGMKAIRDRYADLIRARFPQIPRRVSGYNLDQLLPENGFNVARALVGTESTCALVLEATTRLIHSPQHRSLAVLGYSDVFVAADHVPAILKYQPIGLEGFDSLIIDYMKRKGIHPNHVKLLPGGKGWLLVEFGGESREEAETRAEAMLRDASKFGSPETKLFHDPAEARKIWDVRESALGAAAFVPGEPPAWEGWEDSAVPPEVLGNYLRDLMELCGKYKYQTGLYGHFGQACVHTRMNFDLQTEAGIRKYREFIEEAADIVVRYGGSFSGEHGDGQSRAELLPKMYGHELVRAFEEFKALWDPQNKMNPHKMVHPYRIVENLRLGTDYHPPRVATHFQFPGDHGDFAQATLRCVGVGKCRRSEGGTMCPSYMVTHEEEHSTRGRAHLLFEMMQGQTLKGGWRDEAVFESLDLCLACKGCKGECPVNVDVATYKAEFLSHYYEGRLRPLRAYAVGYIHIWSRLASIAPRLVNFFTQNRMISGLAKTAAGIAPERTIPPYAHETFKDWFAKRERRNLTGPRVIFWPDTFSNYFRPEHAIAAVEVLEYVGYRVLVPRAAVCCGRPLYDFGMLDTAKNLLREVVDLLAPAIRDGTPMVGVEPSCVAVFRDELRNLYPDDQNAMRLAGQTFTLAELLEQRGGREKLPRLDRKAVVHRHCHQNAVMKFDADERLLKHLGVDYQVLESGCCGMAGAFGFEKDHYDVSIKVGERVLLPAVRRAEADTLVVADGFSCQTQILQQTGRKALHLAQVIRMAIGGAAEKETELRRQCPSKADPRLLASACMVGLVVVSALIRGRRK